MQRSFIAFITTKRKEKEIYRECMAMLWTIRFLFSLCEMEMSIKGFMKNYLLKTRNKRNKIKVDGKSY